MAGRPVAGWRRCFGLALSIASLGTGMLWAQGVVPGGQASIYTCITPQGRRITSDRPIPECLGSGQRELSPSGSVKRIVPPVLTAGERALEAERLRQEAAQQSRLDEDKRKSHALVTRYPDQAAHEQARREALEQIDGQIDMARQRLSRLEGQYQEISAGLGLHQRQQGRAPAWLQDLAQENTRQRKAQAAYLAEQLRERGRIVKAFDDELARLQLLWQEGRGAKPLSPAPASTAR